MSKKSLIIIEILLSILILGLLGWMFLEVREYEMNVLTVYRGKVIIQSLVLLLSIILWVWAMMKFEPDTRKRGLKYFTAILWAVYMLSLFYILFRDISFSSLSDMDADFYQMQLEGSNFKPFQVFADYSHYTNKLSFYIQLFGNLALLIPFGIITPILFQKMQNPKIYILATFIGILCVETIQFIFSCGNFDVDDIICNILGAVLGFVLFRLGKKIVKH